MILAAFAVVYINNDETLQQGEAAMQQAYTVWKGAESDSTGKALALSLGNAFIMVSVICAMTFVIVFLFIQIQMDEMSDRLYDFIVSNIAGCFGRIHV